MSKQFKDVQVGDWIFTIQLGWVKVHNIEPVLTYPVEVLDHEGDKESYTFEGVSYDTDAMPSAWLVDPFNNTQPPCEFKKGQVLAFWHSTKESFNYYRFHSMSTKNRFTDFDGYIWDNARALTKEEIGE